MLEFLGSAQFFFVFRQQTTIFNNLKQRQINQIDAKPKANSSYSCNSLFMTTILIWNLVSSAIDLVLV
jgi:hypothetical protein